jgi:hypothetical protein
VVQFFYFQAGFLLNYTYESEEDQEIDTHTTKLKIFSPFDVLKLLDITAFVEIHDKLYHANFTLLTNQSHFTVGGDTEVKQNITLFIQSHEFNLLECVHCFDIMCLTLLFRTLMYENFLPGTSSFSKLHSRSIFLSEDITSD